MRQRRMTFDQLVSENIRELLNDENSLDKLEMRIEKRHEARARKENDQDAELFNEG